jgi:outer membrane protein TolC
MRLNDRIAKLEAGSLPSRARAERWRADMDRAQQDAAEARRKLAALVEAKLAERGIDPNHLPPQTPDEHAQAKRELLQALRARIHA